MQGLQNPSIGLVTLPREANLMHVRLLRIVSLREEHGMVPANFKAVQSMMILAQGLERTDRALLVP